jgi:hypothetical protein
MSGPSTPLLPILALFAVLFADAWVYGDARAHAERGRPVVFSSGTFRVDTPAAWFLGCLLLWIVFFPLYIARRGKGR